MLIAALKLLKLGCCRLDWWGFSHEDDEVSFLTGGWVISEKGPLLDRANHGQDRRPHIIRQVSPNLDDQSQIIGNPMLCWYTF